MMTSFGEEFKCFDTTGEKMEYKLCTPCLFGLEGLVSDELKRMGMSQVAAENGRVGFGGNAEDIARANICLRTGERVLIQVGQFPAESFDELFEGTTALEWENFLPKDAAFPVKGHSIGSALHSIPDCQKIVKKAVVERLKKTYRTSWFEETGAKHQISFSIMKDVATIYLDTTGEGLHKRGYRPQAGAAPLRETLAAAMVKLSRYKGRDSFADPFCGSGTIAIEAALAARNRAPGLNRNFEAENWALPHGIWDKARERAAANEFSGDYEIFAGDIDPECIDIARQNARRAGVENDIQFQVSDAADFIWENKKGVLVTNPPYGERVLERRQAEDIYRAFGKRMADAKDWKMYILSSHTEFEQAFDKAAGKKRKLYNGMIKCDLFMYL